MRYTISVMQREDDGKATQVYEQSVEILNMAAIVMVVNGLSRPPRMGYAQQPLDAAGPVPSHLPPPVDPIDPIDPIDPLEPADPIKPPDYSDPKFP